MTWGWQDVATLAVVASASAYLARKFVPGLSPARKRGGAGTARRKRARVRAASSRSRSR